MMLRIIGGLRASRPTGTARGVGDAAPYGGEGLLTNVAVSVDDVFIGGQLPQAHGTTGMELLGGDAHFAA